MAENNNNKKPLPKPPKGGNGGPNKPDDNFDWAKVIRLVFGWGAVIVAAVIVMQLFRNDTSNYVEISYNQYEQLLNQDKIATAHITKSDVNDYYFKASLKSEQNTEGKTDICLLA
jgi:cell division protease FtsH